MRHSSLLALAALCLGVATLAGRCEEPAPPDAGEVRTWTSVSGATLEARYVETSQRWAVLERPDGNRVRIALIHLSGPDRLYIEELARQALEAEPAPPEDYPVPVGKISPAIPCREDPTWSYHIYLPQRFNLSRTWPVLFVMSPGGGNGGTLKRYLAGAEKNAWILAVSVQSKNGFDASDRAIYAMVKDVLAAHPADPLRLYASGFSGGARMAFVLAEHYKDRDFAGLLPCGAGGTRAVLWKGTVIYGICGSNCFNRWDMACTRKLLRNEFCLRFIPGGHIWAGAEELSDGMSWLNGRYLKAADGSNALLQAERHRYEKQQLADVASLIDTDPERAYRLARSLEEIGVRPYHARALQAHTARLHALPRVQAYQKAEDAMNDLVDRYFATDVMDYRNNNCPADLTRDAEALAETYKELKLAETIRRMGGPTKIP